MENLWGGGAKNRTRAARQRGYYFASLDIQRNMTTPIQPLSTNPVDDYIQSTKTYLSTGNFNRTIQQLNCSILSF